MVNLAKVDTKKFLENLLDHLIQNGVISVDQAEYIATISADDPRNQFGPQ